VARAPIDASIFSIDPVVTPDTRTVRVRALVETPHGDLRPGTFVTATFHVPLGDVLAIPRDAVLPVGAHHLVFVVSDDGRFTPRDVQLGHLAGDYYEVRAGLDAGEHVVTSANFLIDSESRFKAAVAAFAPPTDAATGHP
jgi:Cu(I)/Ag(I) efflux system membrane fusion protein